MSCLSIAGLTHSPTKNKGQIQVILGPMFSGKSTELLRRVKRYQYANHKCVVIKYAKDKRYSDDLMSTHDKQTIAAIQAEKLCDVEIDGDVSVVGIDEGQFFSDIVEFSEGLASQGVRVVVAALDGTFQRKPFGAILNLIPLAESVVKLNSVCMMCYEQAAFTKRIGAEKEIEIIGGADKYMSVCRDCHKAPNSCSPMRKPLAAMNLNKLYDTTPPTLTTTHANAENIPNRQLF